MKRRFHNFSPFLVILFLSLFFGSADAQDVVINEWSAANYDQDQDNFGDFEDWIELYNTSSSSFDLSGHFLSDRIDNPTKWAFPAGTSLGAGQRLLIWCSGRDQVAGGNLHTNFKLTQTKSTEAVVFADPTGTLIDFFDIIIPNQVNDSWARKSDGAATWGVCENPTPDAPNAAVRDIYAATPQMDQDAGWYSGSVTVTLSVADGSTIHYTTNGDFPTAGSPVYAGPINITSNTVLKAVAVSSDPNVPNSFVETNTYFLEEPHSLKVLSIAGDEVDDLLDGGGGGFGGAEPWGSMEYFLEDGTKKDLAFGEFNKHGNDSWAYPQRGFDFITRDQMGYNHAVQDQIFDEKDRVKYQRLIVKAAANDNYPFENGAHIRDGYVHKLSHEADMKMDERTYEPCIVYLNGEYWGVYDIREKVDDGDFTRYYYNQPKDQIDFIKTWGGTWAEYGTQDNWNDLHDYILGNDMTDATNYDYVKSQLNVTSLVDYMILNTHVVCADWLNWNTAWWRGYNPDGDKKKWRYALWDMDATFGHYVNYTGVPDTGPSGDPCFNEPALVDDPEGHTDMLEALLMNEDFNQLYINRYADMNNSYFTCDYMIGLLDDMIAVIEPEMPRQIARWGGSMAGWQSEVQELRDFILTRCSVIDEGIGDCYDVEGPYSLSVDVNPGTNGGKVEINTIVPDNYPWSGEYFSGIDIILTAEPEDGWMFDHWEVTLADGSVTNYTTEEITLEIVDMTSVTAFFVPVGLEFVLDVQPAGAGEIDVNGTLYSTFQTSFYGQPGDMFDLAAIPGADATFDHWEFKNNIPSSTTDSLINFTGNDNDTIVAFFNIEYNISIVSNDPAGGSVFLDGLEITLPYDGVFSADDLISLGALPNDGYVFGSWDFLNNTPNPDATTNEISFTVTAGDVIQVNWLTQPSLTIVGAPINGGSITVDGATVDGTWTEFVNPGDQFTIDVQPNTGFGFVGWFDEDGNLVSSDPEYIYTADADGSTLTAEFESLPQFTVIGDPIEGGIISVDGAVVDEDWTVFVNAGDSFDLEVDTQEGFTFVGWFDTDGNLVSSDPNFNFVSGGGEVLTAQFEPATYEITIVISSDDGTVSVNGEPVVDSLTITVTHGETVDLEALVPEGFTFDGWTSSFNIAPDVSSSNASFVVNGDGSIAAAFSMIPDMCVQRYPSAFSPNGDGANDTYGPFYINCEIQGFALKIFNRWGQMVFESTDVDYKWIGDDGSGEVVPMGVYVMLVEYSFRNQDGEMEARTDRRNITLIR